MKTSACIGMEPSKTSQTRWERHHNTSIPSLHLVPFNVAAIFMFWGGGGGGGGIPMAYYCVFPFRKPINQVKLSYTCPRRVPCIGYIEMPGMQPNRSSEKRD